MTHVSLSDCLILIHFYLFFRFRRTTKEMAKTSNAAASATLFYLVRRLYLPLFLSGISFLFLTQISSILGKISCHRHVLRFSTNAQKYVKQHQTLNSLFGILFKRGVIVQMSRRRRTISHNAAYPKSLIYGVDL